MQFLVQEVEAPMRVDSFTTHAPLSLVFAFFVWNGICGYAYADDAFVFVVSDRRDLLRKRNFHPQKKRRDDSSVFVAFFAVRVLTTPCRKKTGLQKMMTTRPNMIYAFLFVCDVFCVFERMLSGPHQRFCLPPLLIPVVRNLKPRNVPSRHLGTPTILSLPGDCFVSLLFSLAKIVAIVPFSTVPWHLHDRVPVPRHVEISKWPRDGVSCWPIVFRTPPKGPRDRESYPGLVDKGFPPWLGSNRFLYCPPVIDR